MPFPSRRFVLVSLLPALLALGCVVWPYYEIVMAVDGVIIAFALLDALLGRRRGAQLELSLHTPGTWSLGRDEMVRLEISHRHGGHIHVSLALDADDELEVQDPIAEVALEPQSRSQLEWFVTPHKRGQYRVRGVHYTIVSPLGLWQIRRICEQGCDIQVYPNLRQVKEYEILARTNRLSLIGIRMARRIGGETEFERLREHTPNDPISIIDWKATAKRNDLIVRDFNVSQSQTMMFMVDAGRMMTGKSGDGDKAMLDHAIDAVLMLAHVAQRQGDRIGLIVYHQHVCRFIAPDAGTRQVNRIIHALHDVHAQRVESRHDLAYLYLNRHCHKRSLVVHVTQVLDQVNVDQLAQHLSILAKRHLPLAVLLRDPDCFGAVGSAHKGVRSFYEASAAASILNWRKESIDLLKKQGVLTVDCFAEQLTGALVSQYLNIKARHLL